MFTEAALRGKHDIFSPLGLETELKYVLYKRMSFHKQLEKIKNICYQNSI